MRKKKIIFYVLLILLFILLVFLSILSIKELQKRILSDKSMENIYNLDISSPFSVNKIVYFSSANCNTRNQF